MFGPAAPHGRLHTVFQGPPQFSVLGFPVRVEIWFVVIVGVLGISRDWLPAWYVIEWMAVVFVSVLVHELGHALAFRRFGLDAKIVLTGFAGLTYGSGSFRTRGQDIYTSAAGPVTGILVLGLPAWFLHNQLDWSQPLLLRVVVYDLYWVSFIWSFVNLLPILPLDGGHIAEALWGRPIARRLSVAAALVTTIVLVQRGYGTLFLLLLGGLSAYEIWSERKTFGGHRVAVLPPSPGEWGRHASGGWDTGESYSGGSGSRDRKPSSRSAERKRAKRRANLQVVPETISDSSSQYGPGPTEPRQIEAVGWRALQDRDIRVARRALAKLEGVEAPDPFLAPCVELLDEQEALALEGFVEAYIRRPEGPTSLLPAKMIAAAGISDQIAEQVLGKEPGRASAFAVSTLQGHLHFSENYVASARVGERLYDDPSANKAQVAFEVACSWSRVERPDLALKWLSRAVDAGFASESILDNEADLEAARNDPGWEAVRSRLKG